ncbi:hypothetical protein BC938DRAFT_473915 [Jimgerdemannia flammicorona]|uniref:Uncharacterized protein n=1 Tax=Jimgerdemannia flammicorona TaxID=994334 RepID=A0A433Q341_9FUNG|nr:hypothetical protein BC938DRAFT_473915 [Jimgerdemannia flammicorona]
MCSPANDRRAFVTSDAFTTHILLHEVCRSSGPHHIVNCPEDAVSSRLQEFHSQIEEAKADGDCGGSPLPAMLLIKSGVIENVKPKFWVTFLASAFRSIHFAITDAHGAGQAALFNYLLDAGGFVRLPRAASRRGKMDLVAVGGDAK